MCEGLKYSIFIYNPMNRKVAYIIVGMMEKILGLHICMEHGFEGLGGKILTGRLLYPQYWCSK